MGNKEINMSNNYPPNNQPNNPQNSYKPLGSEPSKTRVFWRRLFSRNELIFIFYFCLVFLLAVGILSIFGLTPAAFIGSSDQINDAGNTPRLEEKIAYFIDKVDGGETNTSAQKANTSNLNLLNSGSNQGVKSAVNTAVNTEQNSSSEKVDSAYLPIRVVVDSVNIDAKINNPISSNPTILDESLKSGAVRYPGSGTLQGGNIFIFGHSSRLAVVQNKAYKVFNKLKDIKVGDEIRVYSNSQTYVYRVTNTKTASKYDTWVKFNSGSRTLTLSTCDRFTSATARTVVEAELTR